VMGTRRAIVYLLLVFLLGLALGSVGTFWAWKSGKLRAWWGSRSAQRSPVEWLNRELNLTAEQQKQLEAILDETAAGYRSIRERVGPEYEQVRQAGREKIRAILTPEQRAKFEELVRAIDEERARHRQEYEQRQSQSRQEKK